MRMEAKIRFSSEYSKLTKALRHGSFGLTDIRLPNRKKADSLIDIYFSTIHVAYPFICRQQFMKEYEAFWKQRPKTTVPLEASTFNTLLCTSSLTDIFGQ